MEFINHIYEHCSKRHLLEGIPIEAINRIEEQRQQIFPDAYKEFLKYMGKDVYFFSGEDYSIYELDLYFKDLKDTIYHNFKEEEHNFLRTNDLVFLSSQACNWYFMPLDKGNNPPVYFINESSRDINKLNTYLSFVELLEFHIDFANTRNIVRTRWEANKG